MFPGYWDFGVFRDFWGIFADFWVVLRVVFSCVFGDFGFSLILMILGVCGFGGFVGDYGFGFGVCYGLFALWV